MGAGFVLRRAGAHRVVLAAAFVTILLATTVLSMTSLYVGSVSESGLRRALTDAPLPDRTMQIRENVDTAAQLRTRDEEVGTALAAAFDAVGADVYTSAVSASYALPVEGRGEVEDLAVFASYERLPEHARLVQGQWPAASPAGAVSVVLPVPAARELGLAPGDELVVVNRLTDERVPVSVSGAYTVPEPVVAYWHGDPLGAYGVETGSSFTTYGPLVVPTQTFSTRFAEDATQYWRVAPRFADLEVGDLAALRRGVAALGDGHDPGTLGADVLVETGIGELLSGVETPLLVARSAVTMPAALLVVLAGYTLLLTTRLLGEHRAVEIALLRARGTSSRQLVEHGLREAVLLTAPAALLSPWLAALLLRGYDAVGPLADAGVQLGAQPRASTWLVALLVAVGAAAILVAPTWRQAATYVESSQSLGRQSRRSGLQRAGGDLLLTLVAGLAYWQLARYGSPVLTDVTGQLAVDPLLVLAPVFVLLAGAVLTLRLLPLLSSGAEWLVARGRGATSALGAWQVSRRPRRYTGPALLLVLATAVGAFSVTYATAWTGSQQDQADFRTGADLRLTSVADNVSQASVTQLPGVDAAMPALRTDVSLGEMDAELLAVDAAAAGEVMALRPDLADQPLSTLTDPLVDARPDLAMMAVPGGADTLVVPLRVGTISEVDLSVQVFAVLRDGSGVLHRVSLGEQPADGRERQLRIDLAGHGRPVRLLAVQVQHAGTVDPSPSAAPGDDLLPVRLGTPRAAGYGALDASSGAAWQVTFDRASDLDPAVLSMRGRQPGSTVRAALDPGCCNPIVFSFSLTSAGAPEGGQVLPALVSPALAETLGDDRFVVDTGAALLSLQVAGVLDGVPTVDADESAGIVVDLPSLLAVAYQQTGDVPAVDEWWLEVGDDDPDETMAALGTSPALGSPEVLDRLAYGRELGSDPVGVGILGALTIGFIAAAAFAAIGVAISATVSSRERATEFALLRAVGVGPRQLTRLLGLEHAVVMGAGVLVGLVIGVLVARLVVPVVTLTPQATRPFPSVLVPLPWWQLGLLGLAVLGALAAVLVPVTALLRRRDMSSALRLGEEA